MDSEGFRCASEGVLRVFLGFLGSGYHHFWGLKPPTVCGLLKALSKPQILLGVNYYPTVVFLKGILGVEMVRPNYGVHPWISVVGSDATLSQVFQSDCLLALFCL